MFKNGKIAALCLIAPLSCIGCNNNNNRGKDKMLKRVTYSEVVDKLTDGGEGSIKSLLTAAEEAQVTFPTVTPGEGNSSYTLSVFNIPEKGTLTENADIAISGSIRLVLTKYEPVIELNNVVANINDTIKTSWDLTKGYVKFEDSLGGVNYVVKDGNTYWQCFPNEILGVKYKTDITTFINRLGGGDAYLDDGYGLKNYIVAKSAQNLGYYQIPKFRETVYNERYNMISGMGVDITGFAGYKFNEKRTKEQAAVQYGFSSEGLPYLIRNRADDIDSKIGTVEKALKGFTDATLIHKYAKEVTKFSMEFGFTELDVAKLVEALNDMEEVKESVYLQGAGKAAADYFVAYEDNWIRQQELTINFKDVDFALYPVTEEQYRDVNIIDAKKVNINGVINENLEKDCTADEVNLNDYTTIE